MNRRLAQLIYEAGYEDGQERKKKKSMLRRLAMVGGIAAGAFGTHKLAQHGYLGSGVQRGHRQLSKHIGQGAGWAGRHIKQGAGWAGRHVKQGAGWAGDKIGQGYGYADNALGRGGAFMKRQYRKMKRGFTGSRYAVKPTGTGTPAPVSRKRK